MVNELHVPSWEPDRQDSWCWSVGLIFFLFFKQIVGEVLKQLTEEKCEFIKRDIY